ncbi:hypothetical protein DMH18_26680 [Streptomyces sp. WAC 06783]|uniref:hypothetical protein n=1 Tax=Streptomyces sp. WAC 06783 TaxID=2203211 RepID=UPI000F73F15E|nr:hypothetical protein [Streptomyces sp. WAC 06783]RSO07023.1 hypothetical protein DMH18_26680 [Streptomyces sp. WAC 06783]
MTGKFRFGTFNLFNLGLPRSAEEKERYGHLVETVTEAFRNRRGALAVQEITGDSRADASRVLRMFADDTGLVAQASRPRGRRIIPALASQHPGTCDSVRFHVALLWTPDVEAIPNTLRRYDGGVDFWHGMVTVMLDAGGPRPIKFGSYHANPFSPPRRLEEARRVLSTFQGEDDQGAIGADWNSLDATRRADGSYYDEDQYAGQRHRKLRFQVDFDPARPDAPPAANRDAAIFLSQEPGGLHDIAPLLDVPWEPTCGHMLDERGRPDPFGPGRIDTVRATLRLARTAYAHTTHEGPKAKAASDHLLVTTDYDLNQLSAPQ